jgi:hypothetical protein
MLTKEVSQKYFKDALISIHAKRTNSLFETAWSLTNKASLTISSLGSHKAGSAYVKHKIKSVDRLVGNQKLHKEIPTIYKELFESIILCAPILYILVDWSGCCRQDIHMLRASIVYHGRSLSIYNEIHPQSKYGNRQVQQQFLASLKKMVPVGKKVVVITDAGFSTQWYDSVLKLGWDFIGRLTSYTMINFEEDNKWIKVESFHKTNSNRVKYFGKAMIGKCSETPVKGYIYRYKGKCKNRKDKSKYPEQNKRFSTLYKNPWILATSLKNSEYSGNEIKNLYKTRMQIEQNFRDEKSSRFGFGWRLGRTNDMKRIAVLCLIAHIAAFFLIYIGIMAEKLGLHKKFQVNTSKKRVLSLLTLAKFVIKHQPPPCLDENYKNGMGLLVKSKKELSKW